jgi:uncharacterized protein
MLLCAILVVDSQLPAAGANALLHPPRRRPAAPPPAGCLEAAFAGYDIPLRGWRCRATARRRGTIVYLHGIADNRDSAAGLADKFAPRGFDLIAYDGRAHGASGGDACTYGYYEQRDLRRVLDDVEAGPVVLIGTSLGASVALHAAAVDRRITAVVAAEAFSDLRIVATERAPFFFAPWMLGRAFALAERDGRFEIDAVSPATAAARITVPTLLVHGAADVDTTPAHAQRIHAALGEPGPLILVAGAGHNESLRADVWPRIEQWIDQVLVRPVR